MPIFGTWEKKISFTIVANLRNGLKSELRIRPLWWWNSLSKRQMTYLFVSMQWNRLHFDKFESSIFWWNLFSFYVDVTRTTQRQNSQNLMKCANYQKYYLFECLETIYRYSVSGNCYYFKNMAAKVKAAKLFNFGKNTKNSTFTTSFRDNVCTNFICMHPNHNIFTKVSIYDNNEFHWFFWSTKNQGRR